MRVAAVRCGDVGVHLVGVEVHHDRLPPVHVADPELVHLRVGVEDAVIDARRRATQVQRHVVNEVARRRERTAYRRRRPPSRCCGSLRPCRSGRESVSSQLSARPYGPATPALVLSTTVVGGVVDLVDIAAVRVVDVGEPAVGGVRHADRVVAHERNDRDRAGLQVEFRDPGRVVMLRAPRRREHRHIHEAAGRIDRRIRMADLVADVLDRDGPHDPVVVVGIEEPVRAAAGVAAEGHHHAVAPLPVLERR